ncbi:MAG TPA: FGGY-family carbohydrate kinase, partial [Bryobacteraceae bacterium]|nr:FGGY-family carbohydrate kinase [Bryobacteraceae bacterium]
ASMINQQLSEQGLPAIREDAASLPVFASLIFQSLAHRYGEVLRDVARLTGRQLERIYVVGGGSLNPFLNRLTAETTGLLFLRSRREFYHRKLRRAACRFRRRIACARQNPALGERAYLFGQVLAGVFRCIH